ncbi:transcriptional regulator [Limnohabitans sp. Jir61]|nr:transcriptional regulator [Limnohabitans sp. Jir61]
MKVISSSQIRAARALLRWSADQLATSSGVGVATIRRLELTEGVPSSNAKTLHAIKTTLESAGVEFIGTPENGAGVRFRPSGI